MEESHWAKEIKGAVYDVGATGATERRLFCGGVHVGTVTRVDLDNEHFWFATDPDGRFEVSAPTYVAVRELADPVFAERCPSVPLPPVAVVRRSWWRRLLGR